MKKVLGGKFFRRPALRVAEDLLGKYICGSGSPVDCLLITEVEAYVGPEDKASHASRGKTSRNEPMFGEAGVWYVYLCYGMHWMLNIVTGPKDFPAAVLIRGTENIKGPGKVTKVFGIDKRFNGKPATKSTGLWIEDRGIKIKKSAVLKTPRIGIPYAEEWREKPYRLLIK